MDSAPHSSRDGSPKRSDDLSGAELSSSDEDSGSVDSGRFSQCRSTNFSSGRSWYQSPDHELVFGSADMSGYLNDSGGSLDAFLDALEDVYSDSEKQRDLSSFLTPQQAAVRGTGLFDDDQEEIQSTRNDHLHDEAVDGDLYSDKLPDTGEQEQASVSLQAAEDHPNDDDLPVFSGKIDGEGTTEPAAIESFNAALKSVEVAPDPDPESQVKLDQATAPKKTSVQLVEKKKCVMRLGSRVAEDLLQLDVAEIVKPLKEQSSAEPGVDWSREHLGPDEVSRYVETLDVRETYMDTVWDMEEVLLDTGESSGSHSFWTSRDSSSPVKRTGKSTSVYDGLWKVDSVEVIGARQQRGGASLGERVVGVREHTIYRIRVRSGGKEWEIERRYREFVELHQQMRRMFSAQTRVQLPGPWEKVSLESRKFFGNTSPDAVEIRSALLQVCLQSSLQAGVPISTAAPLLRFLFPTPGESRLPMLTTSSTFSMPLQELGAGQSSEAQELSSPVSFGRTIRLVVQVQSKKPVKQQLLNQRNLCAGCYEQLASPGSLITGFVKTLGWGNPRFCEYTGQLFCSACHLNESAILPSRVLQSWDFTPRPVSQIAKAYLDSIYDQPMLCVSAVNPFLYSKVPILAHLRDTRRRLSRLVECIRCPSRSRIQQLLGQRRYLLEYDDFYALRDLADLSKGAFAVLPGLLRATLEKLSFHVTRKCSVCLELAEACGAGVVCCAPSDLIYPFQDDGIHRCQLCSTVYHRRCFKMIETCKVCTRESPSKQEVKRLERRDSVELGSEEIEPLRRSLFQAEGLGSSNSDVLNASAIL